MYNPERLFNCINKTVNPNILFNYFGVQINTGFLKLKTKNGINN